MQALACHELLIDFRHLRRYMTDIRENNLRFGRLKHLVQQ